MRFIAKKYLIALSLIFGVLYFVSANDANAGPSSINFELKQYGFGAGGSDSLTSSSFKAIGTAGEVEFGSLSSTNFKVNSGLTYTLQANVPPAPTISNPGNAYYNKLKLVINQGGNPTTGSYFAVAISTDNFASDIKYVKSDNTVTDTLASVDWRDYAGWGETSGINIIGLEPGVTYTVKAAAKRVNFTQTGYGPTASVATVNPTLSFSLSTTSQASPPFSVNIGTISPGSVATSSDKVNANISTNGTGGGLIYLYGANAGIKSTTAGNYQINSVSDNLDSLIEGYGARGTTASEDSGGPMRIISPYNGSSNNVGPVDTTKSLFADSTNQPVTNGQASFELKAKAKNTTPAAPDYSDTLTIIASGSF